MVIISGNVSTANGPIAVEDLKVGDLIVDQGHRARKLLNTKKADVKEVIVFKRNKAILSSDAVLLTAYGPRSVQEVDGVKMLTGEDISMTDFNFRTIRDKVDKTEFKTKGYELIVENGSSLFVNGYCVRC